MLLKLGRDLLIQAGLLATVAGGLYAWHKIDKSSAVRRAVVEYVADVELAAAEAEADALRARAEKLETANRELNTDIEQAESEAEDAAERLQEFLSTQPDPPADCTVGPDLLDLLRAN